MTSTPQQALEGERFRRKHLSLMLGGLDAMTAFKAAVGSTPGRVHPNVVRATPFFANRGPSRRIGTVVNTYALTLRSVSDDENRNLEKLFFDENAILLPSRLACSGCADGRVKCFARREGTGYVCAATSEPFGEDKAVLQWVTHWRESAPYDYCGSEAEWLSDLDEVIVGLRQHVPKQGERRWPANTNADQLVRAGVVGEKDLNHDAVTPKQEGDDSEPPRKRRYRSPDSRDLLEADEASLGAIAVGIEQLDFRKAELQDKQKRLKVDLRDRTNEVRRMREEMLALGDSKLLWNSDEGKGRGNGP
ncbi:uncharacterized protein CcaverHIS019_0200270 [Cutaneotrichosporon cavernicola]|uniref:Uncharacterized protein n=1 Tax=Cutaneotrichosporon cavernicola TaxID=279322 RepID=A0AA48I7T5_9TREE|nr:uncharacterized protein CcaverHIS019_0200270 [Cutaneotrichosporon cavernicola]BEI88665.1 hypothetical protein CcaverHIS019_0200270 [Cutaneotrichosporon cavernicola]BEI96439.1 hypothetical protein CcaverHIS631_0200280 [Cutaneotrichosporon cavernicola]BEJ04211.1 hypothetical protein CcaverHIS641_0200280 [Cutaneotrichosporon cavernicola]